MLGALSLKWKWRARREQAGKATARPNLVFGGDVHVVWEKFCRYFDVEPRIIPLQPDKYTIGPEDVEPHVDENTIGVAAVLGHDVHRARRRHRRHQRPARRARSTTRASTSRCTSTRRAAASCGRSSTPTPRGTSGSSRSARSTSPATSSASCTRASAGSSSASASDLPEDLVFYENYLGKRDATFTLNFSTGAAMVLAQYYNFVRFGHDGYRYIMETMQPNARGARPADRRDRRVPADRRRGRRAAAARRLPARRRARLRRVRHRLAARRRARLDGPRLHAAARTPTT